VLKHAEFAHLREVPEFPNALRPVDSELTSSSSSSEEQLVTSQGLSLVREMVRQVGEVLLVKKFLRRSSRNVCCF
jgi:hypothetical protein